MSKSKRRTGLRALGTTTHRPELTTADTDDARLLARAIAASADPVTGLRLTVAQFAGSVLRCNPRTLRRYLAGRDMNDLQREVCEQVIGGGHEFSATPPTDATDATDAPDPSPESAPVAEPVEA